VLSGRGQGPDNKAAVIGHMEHNDVWLNQFAEGSRLKLFKRICFNRNVKIQLLTSYDF